MGKKPKQHGNSTMLKAALCGTAASMIITLGAAAVAAWTIVSGKVGQDRTEIAAWIILFLASFIGSLIASKLTEGKKLQTAFLSWGVFLVAVLLMTALFFGGQYEGVWMGLLVTMPANLITVALNLRQGKAGNKRQWKKPYR